MRQDDEIALTEEDLRDELDAVRADFRDARDAYNREHTALEKWQVEWANHLLQLLADALTRPDFPTRALNKDLVRRIGAAAHWRP